MLTFVSFVSFVFSLNQLFADEVVDNHYCIADVNAAVAVQVGTFLLEHRIQLVHNTVHHAHRITDVDDTVVVHVAHHRTDEQVGIGRRTLHQVRLEGYGDRRHIHDEGLGEVGAVDDFEVERVALGASNGQHAEVVVIGFAAAAAAQLVVLVIHGNLVVRQTVALGFAQAYLTEVDHDIGPGSGLMPGGEVRRAVILAIVLTVSIRLRVPRQCGDG